MQWERQQLRSEVVENSAGPGNIVIVELESASQRVKHPAQLSGFRLKGRSIADLCRLFRMMQQLKRIRQARLRVALECGQRWNQFALRCLGN